MVFDVMASIFRQPPKFIKTIHYILISPERAPSCAAIILEGWS